MKWVKIGAIAIAPVVLIVGLIMFFSGQRAPALQNSYEYIDVVTGETLWLGRKEVTAIPAKNKRDGSATLFPYTPGEDGEKAVPGRYRPAIADLATNGPLKVDPQSGKLKN